MIKPIITDIFLLNKKAQPAAKEDLPVVMDLIDTLNANLNRCVGMAANMIGVNKRIIVVSMAGTVIPMLNPVIVKKSKEIYETEESCLSQPGIIKTVRHQAVEVEFFDMRFQKHRQTYSGLTAQIIQHEIDHCEGILI